MSETAASTPAPAETAETVSGEALAHDLLGETAAVQAPATAATPAAVPAAVAPAPGLRDLLNREFDAKKFRTKPDGSPFLNARGAYMPRGGRKPGRAPVAAVTEAPRASFVPPIPEAPKPAETAATGTPGPTVPPAPAAPVVARSAHERTAERYLRGSYFAVDKAIDAKGEWMPDTESEHQGLKEPLTQYLVDTNAKPLPPWADLALGVLVYVLKRFDRPNTKRAAASWWGKVNGAKKAQPAEEPRAAAAAPAYRSPLEIEPLE